MCMLPFFQDQRKRSAQSLPDPRRRGQPQVHDNARSDAAEK